MSTIEIPTYAPAINLPAPVAAAAALTGFTDVLGDLWVAKGGVNNGNWARARDVLYARVTRATQITGSTSAASFPWQTVDTDVYGMWNGAGAFYMTLPGLYFTRAQVGVNTTATAQWILTYFTQNSRAGTNFGGVYSQAGGTATTTAVSTEIFKSPGGDAVVHNWQCSAALTTWTNSAANSWFIYYVGTG